MSCCLHVLESIYICQNINTAEEEFISPILTNKQIVDLPTYTATVAQEVLGSFLMISLVLSSRV